MARSTSKTDPIKVAAQRLLEDEEVQKHLQLAGTRLSQAWRRASRRSPSKAAQDKKIYKQVREATASLVVAGKRLRKKPEPKRTGRKVVAGAAIAGGAAYVVQKKRSSSANGATTAATDQPVAAPTPPLTAV